jgi:transposase-like protein
MPKRTDGNVEELLRSMLITQLAMAGLTQHQIREIVGVDIHRVNRIVKHFKKVRKTENER